MNRRTFLRTATLSTAAVALQAGGFGSTSVNPPTAAQDGNEVEMIARLEESDPADLGDYSGAVLRIIVDGGQVTVAAGFGDVLQRGGHRTTHFFGWTDGARLALIDPRTITEESSVCLVNPQDYGAHYGCTWLTSVAGETSELRLCISAHCLGVLRGKALAGFFDCLRMRCAQA
jgi:hypothetical protein